MAVLGRFIALRVPRVYLDAPLTPGEQIPLDERAHHHLAQVLRLKPGAPLVVFNGTGGEYEASLCEVARRSSSVLIGTFQHIDREAALAIQLWHGVAKGARMDYALEKAVELGVAHVRPVFTQYTAIRRSNWTRKVAHWRGVIISACEQSGRTRLPTLEHPVPLRECQVPGDDAPCLLLDPRAEQSLGSINNPTHRLTVLIGPEGGLCAQEIAHAECLGFQRVRIGPRILRTETAALVAVTVAQLLWGDLFETH